MIIIYDKSGTRSDILRADMLAVGLPCAVADNEIKYSALVHVFFDDTAHHFADIISRTDRESILYCDGREEMLTCERQRIYNRILDLLDVKYGINPTSFMRDRYSYVGGRDRFCGRLLLPSHTERLIIHYLLFTESEWSTSKEIADFCLVDAKKASSVSSIITKINRESQTVTPFKIISSRRNSGYRYFFKKQ